MTNIFFLMTTATNDDKPYKDDEGDWIILSQDEIDYMVSCLYYMQFHKGNREELVKKIISLPAGRKRLQVWGYD